MVIEKDSLQMFQKLISFGEYHRYIKDSWISQNSNKVHCRSNNDWQLSRGHREHPNIIQMGDAQTVWSGVRTVHGFHQKMDVLILQHCRRNPNISVIRLFAYFGQEGRAHDVSMKYKIGVVTNFPCTPSQTYWQSSKLSLRGPQTLCPGANSWSPCSQACLA